VRPPPVRIAAALLASVAGIATGHAAVYSLAPLSHPGTAALEVAGHSHWPLPWEALPVVLAAATAMYAVGVWHGRCHADVRSLAQRLAIVQSAGFLALETAERLLAVGTATPLSFEPVIVLGLAVQVVVAVAMAGLLTAGAEIARTRPRRRRLRWSVPRADERPHVVRRAPAAVRPGRQSLSFRGPPLPG
jgi:hypothetical protein